MKNVRIAMTAVVLFAALPVFAAIEIVSPGPGAVVPILTDAQKANVPKDRPFFHVQHCHPKGTCGAKPGAPDPLTEFMSQFGNLVCFSGHTHNSLEDDRSFWSGAFTSVNTATLQHVWKPDRTKILNFPQGLLVRVWPDFVHFERRNFRDGRRFDPAWEREIRQEG